MDRETLINHCIEAMKRSITDVGLIWAYLKAGCGFTLGAVSESKIELLIHHPTFQTIEWGEGPDSKHYSIPLKFEREGNQVIACFKSRSDLIALCERAIVAVSKWQNRDSPSAQAQVGQLMAELLAEKPFRIRVLDTDGPNCLTNDTTIWIDVGDETYYLPQESRLEPDGSDWY